LPVPPTARFPTEMIGILKEVVGSISESNNQLRIQTTSP